MATNGQNHGPPTGSSCWPLTLPKPAGQPQQRGYRRRGRWSLGLRQDGVSTRRVDAQGLGVQAPRVSLLQ